MRTGNGFWLLSISLLLMWTGLVFGDMHSIPLDADESHITLLDREADGLLFRMEIGELVAVDVETDEGTFSRLIIPGFHSSNSIGSPELPMMNRLVEVPFGADARIEIISRESREYTLADFGVEHPIMPAQPSMPKNADPDTWSFIYDRDAYLVDRVGQELIRVERLGRLRAADIGRVDISPVEYMPHDERIVVTSAIEFRVHFDGADRAAGNDLKARVHSPFFASIYNQIDGYAPLEHDTHPDLVGDVATYVIITPAQFEAQMQSFIAWKKERGFLVEVGVIGSPEVGITASSIQTYIHGLYNNATPEQPAPSFVLFVGDVADCPTWTEAGDATDRPYCDVEGDLVPDIYYGRFSATNATELQNILDKTLMYDQYTMPDPSYLGNVVMIAGMDGGYGATHGNGQINYGTEHYFNAAHGLYSNTYLYPNSGSNAANIVQNVSDGVSYINYTAHGSITSWSDPSFTQANINGLSNSGEYCLAVGNCCLTSTYDAAECFAETWLRAEDKGAVGYIGGSNSTYWDEDYWWGVGYHPSGEIDGSAYPVASTGIGVYDGLFHENGEVMDNWYVTNDAIVFCGNLAVMESGSSLTTYYWNIYNLMGDPSLTTYMGVPAANPVVHLPSIYTTTPSLTIDAVPGSYCGLTQGGEVVAAGTVDETGTLDLAIWSMLTPGSVHLVVTAQNHEPYITDLPVIVPATILIDPASIDAVKPTEVVVTVLEADGITPKPGIDVWADGLGYLTTPVATNAAGICTLTVLADYGPSINIVGKDPAETWNLFTEPLTVNAMALGTPDLWVTTRVGLVDTFALNLMGTLSMTADQGQSGLWAILPDGTEMGAGGPGIWNLTITPSETGDITGVIACPGYDLYTETFPIIEAYGTLTGYVDILGEPAIGAVVRGYDGGDNLIFQATADASGNYDVGEDILVDSYTIRVDYFGYLPYETAFFVNYGPNVHDIDLIAAPSGLLTGVVSDDSTGQLLQATIKVYRADNMELYTQTVSDSATGAFTTTSLPYFDYVVNVKAWHYKSLTIDITVEDPLVEKDFVLEATVGDILLIDDNVVAAKHMPAKLDEKSGAVIADGYSVPAGKGAADDIEADLTTLGYEITRADMTSDPLTWENFDLLIVSSGDNVTTLDNAAFRTALMNYVNVGGVLLIEGGEVGYDWYSTDATFAETVLHTTDWNHDESGNITVADAGHYVMSVPNIILGPLTMTYTGYGDQDAMVPLGDAVMVGSWTTYATDASIICFDPNPAPEGGQIVNFCFNYAAAGCPEQLPLLENAVNWLLTPEYGNCSVSGTAQLAGETNHSGIRVEATPGGGSTYTDASGSYTLTGLYAGTYDIIATKESWATDATEVTLSSGENLTGIDLGLTPVAITQECHVAALAIPDNDGAGVYDTIVVDAGGATVSAVEVMLDITHTYIGDLIVELTSPGGTRVMLHNRSGGTLENIYGWCPGDLEPAEDMNAFIGDPADGTWIINVSDNAGIDTGTLNDWCVKVTHDIATDVASGAGSVPSRLALKGNVPNPFNPVTTIYFDTPKKMNVNLAVYGPSGRRVATLRTGEIGAGSHQVTWTGRDDSGRTVSSGVYFYRLEAEENVITKKMVLLK